MPKKRGIFVTKVPEVLVQRRNSTGRFVRQRLNVVPTSEPSTSHMSEAPVEHYFDDFTLDSLLQEIPVEEPCATKNKKWSYKERRERLNQTWEDQLASLRTWYKEYKVGQILKTQ